MNAVAQAIDMEDDHLFQLNYAITLFNNDETERASIHLAEFERLFEKLDDEQKSADPDVKEMHLALREALEAAGLPVSSGPSAMAYSNGNTSLKDSYGHAAEESMPAPPPRMPPSVEH